ncbi:DUF4251 domain-containing protein [uncultured Bacteroides sp.]|uniref:DUF4251 domain-containing protein n=1 Tax=uncultured Bacteroides sp. TaxID=162156 RepID=UPI002AAB8BE2|nr:DUF4251 domain-containing protein [uncultured Bacteroides sp.]
MKTNIRIFALLLVFSSTEMQLINAQEKQEKKTKHEQMVKELIDSRNYKINVGTALPRRGRNVFLTSPYSLGVKNDSVFSWLPYYGRAYSIPYGGGNGLSFEAPIKTYKLLYDKKEAAKIEITTQTEEDVFKFLITIYPTGCSHITVNMYNRESIDFSGDLEVKDK